MDSLIDVRGYYTNYDDSYEIENSWYGKVLLNSDNTFEGVVTDYSETSDYFVFGTITSEQITLIKCMKNDEEVPKQYLVYKDKSCFEGEVSAKDLYVEVPMGECRILINPADSIRDIGEYELLFLRNKIAHVKESFGDRTKELYDAFLKRKKDSNKKIIKHKNK